MVDRLVETVCCAHRRVIGATDVDRSPHIGNPTWSAQARQTASKYTSFEAAASLLERRARVPASRQPHRRR